MFFKKKAVHGKLFKLSNSNQKPVESEFYFSLWVENKFDFDERCLLFSQSDLDKIKEVKFCDFKSVISSLGNREGKAEQRCFSFFIQSLWKSGLVEGSSWYCSF